MNVINIWHEQIALQISGPEFFKKAIEPSCLIKTGELYHRNDQGLNTDLE